MTISSQFQEANSLYQKGKSYYNFGQFDLAIGKHKETLSIWKARSSEMARCWYNIGKCRHALGEFEEALKAHEIALDIREKINEQNNCYRSNCNLARSLNNIALCYCSLGNYKKAKELYSQAYSIQDYGLESFYIKIKNRLASLRKFQKEIDGRFGSEEEKIIIERAQKKIQEVDREELESQIQSIRKLDALDNQRLKELYSDLGEPTLEKILEHVTSIYRVSTYFERLELPNFDSRLSYGLEESIRKAETSLNKLESKLSIVLGNFNDKDKLCLARSLHDRGLVRHSLGQFQKALEDHQMAFYIQKNLYGENDPKLVRALIYIGRCLISLGQYTKALKIHERAIGKQYTWFNDEYSLADSLVMGGISQYTLGKFKRAYELHNQAYEIRKQLYGENNPLIADSLTHLGKAMSALRNFDDAEKLLLEAHDILLKHYGPSHLLVADSLHNLGFCYSVRSKYKEALKNYGEAYQIRKKCYGEENHPLVMWSLSCMNTMIPLVDPSERIGMELEQTVEVENTPEINLTEKDAEKITAYVRNYLASHNRGDNNNKLELQKNPSGFIRIQIPPLKELPFSEKISAIRVHYWPSSTEGALSIVEAAHNHPRHFISIIIQGGYSQLFYKLDQTIPPPPKSIVCRSYRILKSGNKELQDQRDIICSGRVNLIESPMEEVKEKSIVNFPRNLIHRVVEAKSSTLTINYVLKSEQTPFFDVYIPTFLNQDPQTDRETVISNKTDSFVDQILSILNKTNPELKNDVNNNNVQ